MASFNFKYSLSYDKNNALLLLSASECAYLTDLNSIKTNLKDRWGFQSFDFFESKETDTQGYVAYDEPNQHVLIAFRGSEPKIADWLNDATISYKKLGDHNVHSGFLKCLNSVWDQIENSLTKANADQPIKRIIITGHSLGGALAAMTLAKMFITGSIYWNNIISVYTFGQPKICSSSFAKILNNQIIKNIYFRVINSTDAVTKLPLSKNVKNKFLAQFGSLSENYDHFGTEIQLNSNDNSFFNWFGNLWNIAKNKIDNSLIITPDNIKDHFINNYKDAILK